MIASHVCMLSKLYRRSVLKDILLVVGSVVLLGSVVTGTQLLGYGIALAGLVVL